MFWLHDKLSGTDLSPDPLPEQAPPPEPVPGGTHLVQLLRTYPDLRLNRDYPFARGGERSVARGYSKAVEKARSLVYVEDQYLWGDHVGSIFTKALEAHPDLHVIAVVPLFPDVEGFNRTAQLVGRRRRERVVTAARGLICAGRRDAFDAFDTGAVGGVLAPLVLAVAALSCRIGPGGVAVGRGHPAPSQRIVRIVEPGHDEAPPCLRLLGVEVLLQEAAVVLVGLLPRISAGTVWNNVLVAIAMFAVSLVPSGRYLGARPGDRPLP